MKKLLVKLICSFVIGKDRRKRVRYMLINRGRIRNSCDIPNIKRYLRNGLIMRHPVGIVISKNVEIGRNCTVYQNVTIGTKHGGSKVERLYPVIGNNVRIYAGSVVVGDVSIGDSSVVGANSVVTKDIPAGEIWAGIPARFIGKNESW